MDGLFVMLHTMKSSLSSLAPSLVGVSAALLISTGACQAQTWPQKQPVKILVGVAAGGTTDTIARIIAKSLSDQIGQSVFIENRPGAAQTISAEIVAQAPADGYTLLMANTPQMAIIPAILKTRYAAKDFAPISIIGSNAFVLCVNSKVPVNSLAEFISYVKARPGVLSYASGGAGNVTHLSMAYFQKLAGLDIVHVPYKGGAPAMADLIAGHVPTMFASIADALPQADAGAIKLLAVSGLERARELPNVPTIRESGYPTYEALTWNGLVAPAGTPKEIIEQIEKAILVSFKQPTVIEQLSNKGIDPVGSSAAEFANTIAKDIKLWQEIVDVADVKEK